MENTQKRNQQTTTTTIVTSNFTALPIELKHDIFSRLPSKPFHICKCVSKGWHSIITSPEFTHYFHTLLSLSSPHSNRLLVLNSNQYLSTLELDNTHEPIISKHNTNILPVPEKGLGFLRVNVVGTCNGLVCILKTNYLDSKDSLSVYNPFTRRAWNVPVLEEEVGSCDCWYGLGYDSAAHDYKIMRIPRPPPPSFRGGVDESLTCREAYLFSFRSWSWKQVEDFKYKWSELFCLCSRPCVFLDGYFHWVVVLDGNNTQGSTSIGIARFDVSREEYSLMELPEVLSKGKSDRPRYVEVEVFEGYLSLQVRRYRGKESWCKFDVWVMKEYGVSESWIPLFWIEFPDPSQYIWTKALAYSTNGDRVLVARDYDYYWCDTDAVCKDSYEYGWTNKYFGFFVCVGRLTAPICGDTQLRQLALDDKGDN